MKTPTGKGETDHHALTKGRKGDLSKNYGPLLPAGRASVNRNSEMARGIS
jgi:hypothetical protein